MLTETQLSSKTVTEDPKRQTLHHRKPKSIGGSLHEKRNRSYVPEDEHRAWHSFFDNLPAQQIKNRLPAFYEIFSMRTTASDLQTSINEEWVQRDQRRIKKVEAWETLFGDTSNLPQITERINGTWFDPDYVIKIKNGIVSRLYLQPQEKHSKKKNGYLYISREEKASWKILFDDLPATEVIRKLRGYHDIFGYDVIKSPLQTTINQGWANTTSERIKNRVAWYTLFDELTPEQIADKVNILGLEPGYRISSGEELTPRIYLAPSW